MRKLGLLLGLMTFGCASQSIKDSPDKPVIECGHLVSIIPVQSDNEYVVQTDKGTFVVSAAISGFKGARVWIDANGYLFIEGTPYGKAAQGFYDCDTCLSLRG